MASIYAIRVNGKTPASTPRRAVLHPAIRVDNDKHFQSPSYQARYGQSVHMTPPKHARLESSSTPKVQKSPKAQNASSGSPQKKEPATTPKKSALETVATKAVIDHTRRIAELQEQEQQLRKENEDLRRGLATRAAENQALRKCLDSNKVAAEQFEHELMSALTEGDRRAATPSSLAVSGRCVQALHTTQAAGVNTPRRQRSPKRKDASASLMYQARVRHKSDSALLESSYAIASEMSRSHSIDVSRGLTVLPGFTRNTSPREDKRDLWRRVQEWESEGSSADSRRKLCLSDIKFALLKGGLPATRWTGPDTPLRYAAVNQHGDLAKVLIVGKANANERDTQGVSALHFSVWANQPGMVKQLLRARASANVADMHGQSPLFFVPDVAMCELLQSHSADMNLVSGNGQSALHLAALNGLNDVTKWMSERVSHSVLHLKDHFGATALYNARTKNLKKTVVKKIEHDMIATAHLTRDVSLVVTSPRNQQTPPFDDGDEIGKGVRTPGTPYSSYIPANERSTPRTPGALGSPGTPDTTKMTPLAFAQKLQREAKAMSDRNADRREFFVNIREEAAKNSREAAKQSSKNRQSLKVDFQPELAKCETLSSVIRDQSAYKHRMEAHRRWETHEQEKREKLEKVAAKYRSQLVNESLQRIPTNSAWNSCKFQSMQIVVWGVANHNKEKLSQVKDSHKKRESRLHLLTSPHLTSQSVRSLHQKYRRTEADSLSPLSEDREYQESAATAIQAHIRGKLTRQRHRSDLDMVRIMVRRASAEKSSAKVLSAIIIQKNVRGWRVRRVLSKASSGLGHSSKVRAGQHKATLQGKRSGLKAKRENAAVKVQALVRGFLVRRDPDRIRRDASVEDTVLLKEDAYRGDGSYEHWQFIGVQTPKTERLAKTFDEPDDDVGQRSSLGSGVHVNATEAKRDMRKASSGCVDDNAAEKTETIEHLVEDIGSEPREDIEGTLHGDSAQDSVVEKADSAVQIQDGPKDVHDQDTEKGEKDDNKSKAAEGHNAEDEGNVPTEDTEDMLHHERAQGISVEKTEIADQIQDGQNDVHDQDADTGERDDNKSKDVEELNVEDNRSEPKEDIDEALHSDSARGSVEENAENAEQIQDGPRNVQDHDVDTDVKGESKSEEGEERNVGDKGNEPKEDTEDAPHDDRAQDGAEEHVESVEQMRDPPSDVQDRNVDKGDKDGDKSKEAEDNANETNGDSEDALRCDRARDGVVEEAEGAKQAKDEAPDVEDYDVQDDPNDKDESRSKELEDTEATLHNESAHDGVLENAEGAEKAKDDPLDVQDDLNDKGQNKSKDAEDAAEEKAEVMEKLDAEDYDVDEKGESKSGEAKDGAEKQIESMEKLDVEDYDVDETAESKNAEAEDGAGKNVDSMETLDAEDYDVDGNGESKSGEAEVNKAEDDSMDKLDVEDYDVDDEKGESKSGEATDNVDEGVGGGDKVAQDEPLDVEDYDVDDGKGDGADA